MKKNILITGGNGFIGKHLQKSLAEHNVTIFTKTKKSTDVGSYIYKNISDITQDDLIGIDEVYHLASTVDNYNIHTDPYLDANVNILGTIKLLECCKNMNIKIVYVSTFFATGNPKNLPANIDDKDEPLGVYGATKLCAEHICKVYNRVYNMNIKIVRLTNVYGSGDQYLNNKKSAFVRMIYLAITKQDILLYDNGKYKRDYIHVLDVVSALKIVMDKGSSDKVYYIGTGVGLTLRDMVNNIIELYDTNVVEIQPPEFHVQVGINDFWCDNSELIKLGWSQKINLVDGIIETANDIKKELCYG